jgi:hypothetical protein
MNHLLKKGALTHTLNTMRSLFPHEYDFYPRTWFLPRQLAEFSEDCEQIHKSELNKGAKLTHFIVKPNEGSQGEGIYLIRTPDEYLRHLRQATMNSTANRANNSSSSSSSKANKLCIVQEYIDRPYLIDGLKFDLRIYVLIVSLSPLQVYICDEGLARFATVDYQPPDEHNQAQVFMHLTNYSLNKKSDSYKFTQCANTERCGDVGDDGVSDENSNKSTPERGSKRKLSNVFLYMKSTGINVNKIRESIDELVVKSIVALYAQMKVECAFDASNAFSFSSSTGDQKSECFQVRISSLSSTCSQLL